MGSPSDVLQGTLDLLLVRTLNLGPAHGCGIALTIQQASRDVVNQGPVRPALQRLEQQG